MCVVCACLCVRPQWTMQTSRSNPWREEDVGVAGKCRVPAKTAQHSVGTMLTKLHCGSVQHNHSRTKPALIRGHWCQIMEVYMLKAIYIYAGLITHRPLHYSSCLYFRTIIGLGNEGVSEVTKRQCFRVGTGTRKSDQTSAPSSNMQRRSTR